MREREKRLLSPGGGEGLAPTFTPLSHEPPHAASPLLLSLALSLSLSASCPATHHLDRVLGRHLRQALAGKGRHGHLRDDDRPEDGLRPHALRQVFDLLDPHLRLVRRPREEDKDLVGRVVLFGRQDGQVVPGGGVAPPVPEGVQGGVEVVLVWTRENGEWRGRRLRASGKRRRKRERAPAQSLSLSLSLSLPLSHLRHQVPPVVQHLQAGPPHPEQAGGEVHGGMEWWRQRAARTDCGGGPAPAGISSLSQARASSSRVRRSVGQRVCVCPRVSRRAGERRTRRAALRGRRRAKRGKTSEERGTHPLSSHQSAVSS